MCSKEIVFNMITEIKESLLTKHVSCGCKCIFDGRTYNSNQMWNNYKYWWKKDHICKKDYIWNSAICTCEHGKYLASINDDSGITCDEIIDTEETKTIPKNIICETKIFYVLLAFLLKFYYLH